MVYGINQAICLKCGRPFTCGDCIENFCSQRCEDAYKNGTELMDKCLDCGKEIPADLSPNFFGELRIVMCDECIERRDNIRKEVTGLDHESKKRHLKQNIHKIMIDALSGTKEKYRYHDEKNISYIRWGMVQRHIDELIDIYWPTGEKNEQR
jgi:hypothetical protein